MFNFSPAIPGRSDLDWCWYLRRHGEAGEALERVLHNIGVMDPGGWAAWGRSQLTATGAPVEMLFSSGQPDLQLTTEVADPITDPTSRVAEVCRIMRSLGAKMPPSSLRDVISAAQGTGPLRYGAWLGLRQSADGLHCTLTAELPATASDLSDLICSDDGCPSITDLGDNTKATMVSFDGTTGQVTLHFEMQNATRRCLPDLAKRAQVCPEVLSMTIDSITDRPASTAALPVSTLGFSYTIGGAGAPPILTLSLSAIDAFGSDAKTARRIKRFDGQRLMGYGALVDNLPPMSGGQCHHGRIGLTARVNAAPQLSIGVAAPWSCLFDDNSAKDPIPIN